MCGGTGHGHTGQTFITTALTLIYNTLSSLLWLVARIHIAVYGNMRRLHSSPLLNANALYFHKSCELLVLFLQISVHLESG